MSAEEMVPPNSTNLLFLIVSICSSSHHIPLKIWACLSCPVLFCPRASTTLRGIFRWMGNAGTKQTFGIIC
ncbi:MAG: hypothetical protein ABJ263_12410, partial [Tateyamaria sp.]